MCVPTGPTWSSSCLTAATRSCTVFLVLAMGYVFSIFCQNGRHGRRCVWGFALGSLALFALFYPALSGLPVNNALATRLLGWLPSWPF